MRPIADVINHVIEVADVDGVIRRIDVNDVVERIDVDRVVQRIDIDRVMARIDLDKQLERVDFDSILRRVDTNFIIARSSTGVFTIFMDNLRTQVMMTDLYLRIVTRCRIWREQHRQRCYLPPAPGSRRQRDDKVLYPKGRTNKAIAVQGRYCGVVSKTVAIFVDVLTITLMFAMLFRLIEWCLILFLGESRDEAHSKTKDLQSEGNILVMVLYFTFWFQYFFLSVALAGRTFGMAVIGLKVCNCNQASNSYSTASAKQAFVRTCLLPITLTFFPPIGIIGLLRRDGRMLHDLVANTGIVYLWNAQLAKLRQRALRQDTGGLLYSDEDAPDELDEIFENEMLDATDDPNATDTTQGQEALLRYSSHQVQHAESSSFVRDYNTIPRETVEQSTRSGCFHVF